MANGLALDLRNGDSLAALLLVQDLTSRPGLPTGCTAASGPSPAPAGPRQAQSVHAGQARPVSLNMTSALICAVALCRQLLAAARAACGRQSSAAQQQGLLAKDQPSQAGQHLCQGGRSQAQGLQSAAAPSSPSPSCRPEPSVSVCGMCTSKAPLAGVQAKFLDEKLADAIFLLGPAASHGCPAATHCTPDGGCVGHHEAPRLVWVLCRHHCWLRW